MTSLFDRITLCGVTARNRVWLAPMCQYSVDAHDGVPTDWHFVHSGRAGHCGFGLVLTEASAVTPEGRISAWDVGIWNDEQTEAWGRITGLLHSQGAATGTQLGHAGRKASTRPPGQGGAGIGPEDGGWTAIAPSAHAYEQDRVRALAHRPPQQLARHPPERGRVAIAGDRVFHERWPSSATCDRAVW